MREMLRLGIIEIPMQLNASLYKIYVAKCDIFPAGIVSNLRLSEANHSWSELLMSFSMQLTPQNLFIKRRSDCIKMKGISLWEIKKFSMNQSGKFADVLRRIFVASLSLKTKKKTNSKNCGIFHVNQFVQGRD